MTTVSHTRVKQNHGNEYGTPSYPPSSVSWTSLAYTQGKGNFSKYMFPIPFKHVECLFPFYLEKRPFVTTSVLKPFPLLQYVVYVNLALSLSSLHYGHWT